MLQMLRARGHRTDEEGFTLIELMVVVLIIAILLAIAIPTFLGARSKAQDRAAQSNLRNALTAEKTFYVDNQAYTGLASDLKAIEPSLTYQPAAVTAASVVGDVSVTSATADGVILASRSASGKCFYLQDSTTAGTTYGSDSACPATAASYGQKW
jgi:type IV pilus assembly protein PilA